MRFNTIILLTFFTLTMAQAQRQLDIEGNPSSADTVASIKVNYQGEFDVVGLSVISQPDSLWGIGGHFKGGLLGISAEGLISAGVFGKSNTANGVHGRSTTGYGVRGNSSKDYGIYGSSDSTYGVYGFGPRGGIRGESNFGSAVYGESTNGFGVFGKGSRGVYGSAISNPSGYQVLPRAGVIGQGDTIGVYGSSVEFKGRGIKGFGGDLNSIGVIGIAPLENSTGVWGEGETGGFFKGSGGTAIQLGGVTTPYGDAPEGDESVVHSQKSQPHSDLIFVTNDQLEIRLDNDENSTSHFKVFNGDGDEILSLNESGNLTITGIYSPSSDINRKEQISPVNISEILEKVATLTISEWQFQGDEVRHIGPMAQDFYAAFGIGENNTNIATVDADGVALAAIQAQQKVIIELKTTIKNLTARISELENSCERIK